MLKACWLRFAHLICILFFGIVFRVRYYGVENFPERGAVVLVSNHQSFLDPVLCGMPLRRYLHFLARDSLFSNRLVSILISSLNAMPFKRERADAGSLRRILRLLRKGRPVCLFPEGTRTRDGRVSVFKPGFGFLCKKTGAALVPVAIDGAFECWPREKKIFSPGSIAVRFGRPVPEDVVEGSSDRELAELTTDTVRRMQNDCRRRRGLAAYEYGGADKRNK